MFKLESFITPYILAYLDKYIKNFNPADFQVSLWGGGAAFTNLNLNLDVLDKEFNLPVSFVSGHIHELRITVPWTKLTYEPIVINVNTIEISLKLKSLCKEDAQSEPEKPSAAKEVLVVSKDPNVPTSYVQSLLNKLFTNVRFQFENVIVKYVEEDIVLSLNIMKACMFTVDGNWKGAFVDLVAPDFELRKKVEVSDLTICLDKCNSAGKIDAYQEPLLYKCSFNVRILQKYRSPQSKKAHFTRTDVLVDKMEFCVTNEQVPMLMRLYTLIVSLSRVNLKTLSLNHPKWISPKSIPDTSSLSPSNVNDTDDKVDAEEGIEDDSGVLNWASWAVNSVSSVVFGDYEEEDESIPYEEPEPASFVSHLAFFVNKTTVTFKAFERVYDKSGYDRRTIKVRFLPFLKWRLQGIMTEWISQCNESAYHFSLCEMGLEGIGFCPCGIVDCTDNEKEQNPKIRDRNVYFTMGKQNEKYFKGSLFNEVKEKPEDGLENQELTEEVEDKDSNWCLNEKIELMKEGLHAFAMEYTQIVKEPKYDKTVEDSDGSDSGFTDVDMSSDELRQRIVVGQMHLIINSGLIHRLKMIHYAVKIYNYDPYDHVHNCFAPKVVSTQEPNFKYLHNFQSAFDVYEMTFIKPVVEIYAADHPDYDSNSRVRHTLRRRRMTTTTPLSFVVDNWPKILISIGEIKFNLNDPSIKFKAVVEKSGKNTPKTILDKFKKTSGITISDVTVDLNVGNRSRNIFNDFSGFYHEEYILRSDLPRDKSLKHSWKWGVKSDGICIHLTFAQLMLLKIMYLSYYNEALSEHLTISTILEDQSQGFPVAKIHFHGFQYLNVIAPYTTTKQILVGNLNIAIGKSDLQNPVPIFVGCPKPGEHMTTVIIQHCTSKPEKLVEGSAKFEDVTSTPIFLADISEFKMQYCEYVIEFLNYKSKQQHTTVPLSVRMSKEVMAPMTPLSRSETGSKSLGAGSACVSFSATSIDTTSISGTDFQALFKSKSSSRVTESHGSSFNYIPEKIRQSLSNLEVEEEKHAEDCKEDEVQSFERYIVQHLSEIKNTLTIINMGGVEIWFPLNHYIFNFHNDLETVDGVVLCLEKSSLQPRAIKKWTSISEHKLPISVPSDVIGRDLYPLLISLENMSFSTVNGKGERHICSAPLSVMPTFSLTQKLAEGKSPIIAAYLHCDISAYKLSFSHAQIRIIRKLLQNILHSLLSFTKQSGFGSIGSLPTLATQNITFESTENLNSAASDTSAYIESIISHSKGVPSSLKRHSITPSPPAANKHTFTDEEEPLPPQGVEVAPVENCETKATLWLQITLTQFQVVVFSADNNEDSVPKHKLVLEINDVLSSLDFQSVFVKWNLKVTNFNLRSYKRNGNDWDFGQCLGVIVSSSDDITRAIHVAQCPKNVNNAIVSTSGSSSPVPNLPSTGNASKMRGILVLTFTSVLSNNFHKKADVPSPVSRWISTVEKYHDKNYDDYMPFERADDRCLHEIDIILRSMDFVICPTVFKPFDKILQEILAFKIPENILASPEIDYCSIPYLNNNSMPLVYLQTESLRIFLKSEANERQSINCPDGAVIQFSSINLQSQSENALHRTKIRPHLYSMAERARILSIPGSPVEDRQYQIDFHGFSMSTCKWKDLEDCSRRMLHKRPSAILKTQGENPALDWNNMLGEVALDEVEAEPLIDGLEICLNFAPAIVYDRCPGIPCKSLVVAGYSAELNFTNDTSLYLNLNQLHFIEEFIYEAKDLACQCSISGVEEEQFPFITPYYLAKIESSKSSLVVQTVPQSAVENTSIDVQLQEVIISSPTNENVAHTDLSENPLPSFINLDSVANAPLEQKPIASQSDESQKVQISETQGQSFCPDPSLYHHHRHTTDKVPFDLLITGSALRVTIYDIKMKTEKDISVTPIGYAFVGQPHLMLSTASSRHRAEASVFELCLNLASPSHKQSKKSRIPEPSEFNLKLFESILGERNPKTGMVAPLITLNINEILEKRFRISMDITRPLKLAVNRSRIENVYRFLEVLQLSRKSSVEPEVIKVERDNSARRFITSLENLSVNFNQLVVCLLEEPCKLPGANITFSWTSAQWNIYGAGLHKKLSKQGLALKASGSCHLGLVTLSTAIGDRTDLMVNPFNINLGGKCRWKDWTDEPYCIVSGELDPVIVNFGTNNILAFAQVYHGLHKYFQNFSSYESENNLPETVENDNTSTAFTVDVFKDDLRAGAFHYKNSHRSDELPLVYEIVFCESQRIMTWRYPQPRALICIEASQVPLDPAQFSNLKEQKLQCVVEYWDECNKSFRFYGILYISEEEKGQVIIPQKDKLHAFISTMWRIRINTPLEDSDGQHLVKPELLAACLKVDSIYEPAFLPKLKANFVTPRVCVNLINHLYYSGKAGDERLRQYTMGGLTFYDQPFATVDISMNSLMIGSWINQSSINYSGFIKIDVVDYAYLTNINVIEPIKIKLNSLFHTIPNSNSVNWEMNVFTKPIVLKLGASSAHTLMSSIVTWSQVLENYDGKKVDFKNFEYRKNIILSRNLVCNDMCHDLALKHEDSEKQITIRSRECYGIVFPSEHLKLKYKIGLRDVEWKWSSVFDCSKVGSTVVNIPSKGPLFVNISSFSSSQRLINISGCLTLGNILEQSVEVALFSRHNSTEVKWIVQSRAYGSSQMIDIKDIEHLRFRYVSLDLSSHPWSGVVTVKDLKDSPNGSVGLQLYKEESGSLQIYNVWCTLIEELHDDIPKYLIVVCPFFRMRSCVSFDTIAHITTSKKDTETTFVLPGKCVDMQVEFLGDFGAAHHLTFKTYPHLQASTPSIPLLPNGPAFKAPPIVRPIDQILKKIVSLNCPDIHDEDEVVNHQSWPYIDDDISLKDWVPGNHNEKEIEVVVGSESWVEGLPTVLLEAKPWALFINLCGAELLVSDAETDKISCIPSRCPFSPKKFASKFKIGIQSPSGTFWSLPLNFTEQKFRTDVHHVNTNCKIPLDCFSRLEIHGAKEIFYFTLEAKIHKGIIIMAVRPTFTIKNETGIRLMAHGVSLVKSKIQNPEDWSTISKYSTLKPTSGNEKGSALPILAFSCNCEDYVVGSNGLKYLALSCGGPWWFVQLMKFELIFDNMSANIGFPAKRIAIALPKFGSLLSAGEMQGVTMATEPVVLSWMSKNGQVWISLKPDTFPQLTISNKTNVDLVYARASDITNIPCEETEHFEQYLLLPKNTKGHYTFQSSNSKFPDLNAGIKETLPSLIIARVLPEKLPSAKMNGENNITIVTSPTTEDSEVPRESEAAGMGNQGTLIFSELLGWSREIRIDGENISQQYYRLSDSVDIKVHVERLCQSYFIYIENTSSIEVSAKDIRGRISGNAADHRNSLLNPPISTEMSVPSLVANGSFSENPTVGDIVTSSTYSSVRKRHLSMEFEDKIATAYRNWECRAFFPEMRLVITDDLPNPVQKPELLSFTFQDILLEQKSYTDKTLLRTLNNKAKELSVVNLKIGDFQVDSPSHGDKKCDFSVILKQETEYKELPNFDNNPSIDFLPYFLNAQRAEGGFMIQGNFHLASNSPSEKRLEEVYFKFLPFSVYVEDQFLENVLPSLQNISQVVEHSLSLFSSAKKYHSQSNRLIIKNTNVKKHSNIILDVQESQSNSRITFTTNKTSPLSQLTFPSQSDFNISVSDADADASSQAESFYTSVNDLDTWKEMRLCKSLVGKHHNTPHRLASVKSQPEPLHDDSVAGTEKEDSVNLIEIFEDNESVTEYSWLPIQSVTLPSDVNTVLNQFSHPIWLRKLCIEPCNMFVTFRMFRKMYLAVDHSPMHMDALYVYSLHTTSYGLGQSIAAHYFKGAVFQVKNPLRLIGSMELLGSPGSLARSVGTGLRDFVVYPYQGLFHGPTGFLSGLTHGFSSLLKNVTAGTLTSVTNWAWSVSRNIDKFTLDKDEQIFAEEGRRVEVEGFSDGLIQGFTGFGIRLLGAVGGIAHHPIQNVIEHGASPSSVISGVGKGIIGVVTKPIGGAVELVAMTGQGLLRGAGWTPQLKMKHDPYVEHLDSCSSSLLKLRWRLFQEMEGEDEKFLLAVDATRLASPLNSSEMTFVSCLLTTQKLYVVTLRKEETDMISYPIAKLDMDSNENVVTVKPSHSKRIDEMSLAEERIIEFVRGYSDASCKTTSPKSDGFFIRVFGSTSTSTFPSIRSPEDVLKNSAETQDISKSKDCSDMYAEETERFQKFSKIDPVVCGDYMMSPIAKMEFVSTFAWAKMNDNDLFFRFC